MSAANEPNRELSTEAFQRQERVVKAFEDAWQRGERPNIDDYLKSIDAERRLLLAELVHVDLERRWGAGEAVPVEQYLQRYPELAHDSRLAVDLIAAEYELCGRRQPCLLPEHYLERFPAYRADLAARLAGRPRGEPPPNRRHPGTKGPRARPPV